MKVGRRAHLPLCQSRGLSLADFRDWSQDLFATPICPTRDSESVEPCRPVVVSLVADGGRCPSLSWLPFITVIRAL
jgi:hypothetical protein